MKTTVIEYKSLNELISIVKDEFRSFDDEGLIDPSKVVKTVMYCNEKLGLPIREIKEVAIRVDNFKAELPLDFERLYYVSALNCSNTGVATLRNAFDNNVDQDVIYKAELDRQSLGCAEHYLVRVERQGVQVPYFQGTWTPLSVAKNSYSHCHQECPNKRKPGKYEIEIKDGYIQTPFRTGMLYLVYVGLMVDEEGNIVFPFHPLITPYYEWSVKEKILSDAVFNSDKPNLGELLKYAKSEVTKAWLDAFNFTTDRSYNDYIDLQRKKEVEWYHRWFKYFQ